MSRWKLEITGEGPAMNHRNANDADQLAGVLLRELVEHGHTLDTAYCVSGGQRSVVTVAASEKDEDEGKKPTMRRA